MSSILIIDHGFCAAAMCLRFAEEGHHVKWFLDSADPDYNKHIKQIGDNFPENIEKVDDWAKAAKGVDLIIPTENTRYLDKLERARNLGMAVWAPSQAVADLEIKRNTGLKFFEKHGLQVPEYKEFKSLEEAEAHVWKNPDRYVFKTLGDNADKALSHVSKSPGEMIQQLQRWQELKLDPKGSVILQKFTEGIEMSVSAMVGSEGFVGPYLECFENKKLFPGNKGPNTGEMGSTLKYVKKSKLAEDILKPLEADLVKMKAFCNFDLNTIIDKDGTPWILEATARWGWPETNIQLLLHDGDQIQWMIDAIDGKDTFKPSLNVGMGVVLVIPDFPHDAEENKDKAVGIPLYGVTAENEKYIQPQLLKMGGFVDEDESGELSYTSGYVSQGTYIAVVVSEDKTIQGAQKKAYKVIDELSMSNLGYRDDIGEREKKALPKLQDQGYAMDWKS